MYNWSTPSARLRIRLIWMNVYNFRGRGDARIGKLLMWRVAAAASPPTPPPAGSRSEHSFYGQKQPSFVAEVTPKWPLFQWNSITSSRSFHYSSHLGDTEYRCDRTLSTLLLLCTFNNSIRSMILNEYIYQLELKGQMQELFCYLQVGSRDFTGQVRDIWCINKCVVVIIIIRRKFVGYSANLKEPQMRSWLINKQIVF